jgi:signal transduction histidine kinase/CheY-like chemotaxis protein
VELSYVKLNSSFDLKKLHDGKLQYQPYQQEKIKFGHDTNAVIFKLKLKNKTVLAKDAVLVVEHKYFNNVSYLTEFEDGSFSRTEQQFRLKSTQNRIFSSEKFVFNFNNKPAKNHYVIIESHLKSSVAIKVVEKDIYIGLDNRIVIFFTILYSSMFGLFLVNFIYFLFIRNSAYLYYSIYIISALVAIYWQEGRMIDFSLIAWEILGKETKLFYFLLSNLLLLVFIYAFLKLEWKKQLSAKLMLIWIIHLFLLVVASVVFNLLAKDSNLLSSWYNYTLNIGNFIILGVAFIQFRRGNRQAIFLLVSWVLYILFSMFRLKFVLDPGPNHFFMQHSYEIGLVVQAFVLGLGLADQALGYKKSRDRAKKSFTKASKALFAESLINNFLHEIKDVILNENKIENFMKHIERKFSDMIIKFAPIENAMRVSIKDGICQKNLLFQNKPKNYFVEFFEEQKDYIRVACENKSGLAKIYNPNARDKKIQFIVIPVTLSYDNEVVDHECIVFEVKVNCFLDEGEVENLRMFIDKSQEALIDSKQLKQITKHAQSIISVAEEKEKSMRMKDRFFANVSHEFRTPLTLTIAPLKDLSEQKEFLNTSGKYLVDTALSNAQELMSLVNRLLDIQKLATDTFPLRVTKVNLNELIYSVIKKLINWSLDHYQSLTFEKSYDEDIYVYCDKKEITKVLTNLISNAIKYSGNNSHITVSMEISTNWVKLNIADDGLGIEKDIQEHIFERYFQGDSTYHLSEAGTGIGLSYVKDVMELHHGKVTLVSEKKQGSSFSLWFKQGYLQFDYNEILGSDEKSTIQDIDVTDVRELEEVTGDNKHKKDVTTLLIVEDNAELRKFLVYKFKDHYKVIEAENGKVGLEKALSKLPDIVISDVMMPEMDGMELVKRLRGSKELKTIPIVLLTAKSANVETVEGLEKGADDYVTKPFDFNELKARVDRLIFARKAIRDELPNTKINSEIKEVKSAFQEKLDEAIFAYISDTKLSVEKLAETLFLERSSLYRKIKSEFNMSPIKYIRKIRMGYSLELLKNKKLTVSETAYACGFDSLSYFSKQFKKTYGKSPSDVL